MAYKSYLNNEVTLLMELVFFLPHLGIILDLSRPAYCHCLVIPGTNSTSEISSKTFLPLRIQHTTKGSNNIMKLDTCNQAPTSLNLFPLLV